RTSSSLALRHALRGYGKGHGIGRDLSVGRRDADGPPNLRTGVDRRPPDDGLCLRHRDMGHQLPGAVAARACGAVSGLGAMAVDPGADASLGDLRRMSLQSDGLQPTPGLLSGSRVRGRLPLAKPESDSRLSRGCAPDRYAVSHLQHAALSAADRRVWTLAFPRTPRLSAF